MNTDVVDICVIEDDPDQRLVLTRRLLKDRFSVVQAASARDGVTMVFRYRPRIVICDLMLPDGDAIDICRRLRQDPTLDGVYFVVVTAAGSARKTEALKSGADDYLTKPINTEELRARIRNGLRAHQLQERLHRAALTDGLTDLWNHTQFRDRLNREFLRMQRYGGDLSLLMMDLDHFKAVNDTYGHEYGNVVLRETARHLRRSVREIDTVARYGGEEFAVVCPQTRQHEAVQLAERIRRELPHTVKVPNHPDCTIHCSIGVSCTSDPRVESVNDLVNLGDQALYASKRNGRNRVTCATQLDGDTLETEGGDEIDRMRKELVALTMRSKEMCLQSVWALIQALEARDGYSAWHSRNVKLYTTWLVDEAHWPTSMAHSTINAAMLHDVGKIGIPDELLFKPRPLDAREAAIVRQVPAITCKILEPLKFFEREVMIIRHLREHFDGTGYPDGLSGQEIPIGSRLLAIAEAFDSMTCNRAYRPGRSIDEVMEEFHEEAGRQFDPCFVELLDTCISRNRERWQAQITRARIELPGFNLLATELDSLNFNTG